MTADSVTPSYPSRAIQFLSPAEVQAVMWAAERSWQDIVWHDGMIVTTPHHGAEANKQAYNRFQQECGRVTVNWVRSDCRSKRRPGNAFMSVRGSRFCTICRGTTKRKTPIEFHNRARLLAYAVVGMLLLDPPGYT